MAGFSVLPVPAAAQMAIESGVHTDYRSRGYSVSGGRAAASVSINYDDPSGVYVGGLAAGMIAHGDPELLLLEGHAGYAFRIAPGLSLDLGAAHNHYSSGYGTDRDYEYSEAYVGLASQHFSSRISYSPNYYFRDTPTLYAEVSAGVEPATNWFLSAHAGALFYLAAAPYALPDRRYDWRVNASRKLGRYGIHAEVSGRIQGERSAIAHDKAAALISITRSF